MPAVAPFSEWFFYIPNQKEGLRVCLLQCLRLRLGLWFGLAVGRGVYHTSAAHFCCTPGLRVITEVAVACLPVAVAVQVYYKVKYVGLLLLARVFTVLSFAQPCVLMRPPAYYTAPARERGGVRSVCACECCKESAREPSLAAAFRGRLADGCVLQALWFAPGICHRVRSTLCMGLFPATPCAGSRLLCLGAQVWKGVWYAVNPVAAAELQEGSMLAACAGAYCLAGVQAA
jgi:hypothetical protein